MADSRNKQEELNQLAYLQNMYSREYEALTDQISNYLTLANSFERNREVLTNMDKVQNSNMLVSLEAGMFAEVSAKKVTNVITNVGAGYMIEKTIDEAKEFIGKNSERLNQSVKKLMEQRQRMEAQLLDLSYKINEMQQSQ